MTKITLPDHANSQIEDVQASLDTRRIAINKVGIKDIRHPMQIQMRDGQQQGTVATFNMYVNLPEDQKGTHMSRFVAILNTHDTPITVASFRTMLSDMTQRLDATAGYLQMTFPYFIRKTAPISGEQSLLDYEVTLTGTHEHGNMDVQLKVLVAATSLCPCSKKISDYGAHNQRSHITINAKLTDNPAEPVWAEELIELAETQASCELFGILKRPDEKYVTERAYDNPKFVEDLVRDIAASLNQDERISGYTVESENFESIHNHSAYALIEHDKQ